MFEDLRTGRRVSPTLRIAPPPGWHRIQDPVPRAAREKEQTPLYIGIGTVVLIVIIVLVILMLRRR
jgi:hypothetical protein